MISDIIGAFRHNRAVPTDIPTMASLLDLVRARRAELEAAASCSADDEKRAAVLMTLLARARSGDAEALATIERLEAAAERDPAMTATRDFFARMRAEALQRPHAPRTADPWLAVTQRGESGQA